MSAAPRVGVLAVQGDVREHVRALAAGGADPVGVRRPEELDGLHGLVVPGGESTTIDRLTRIFGLREPLVEAIGKGLPVYGSCAGMIMLADRIVDGRADQQTLGGLAVTVRRNAFGRQVASFEADLEFEGVEGPPVRGVFIRAPWVEAVDGQVRVLSRVDAPGGVGRIVAVRQGNLLATSFHPEITGDTRVHRYFVDMVRGATG